MTVRVLDHFTLEMLCKDLPANPCREMLVGGFCPALRKHLKRKMLSTRAGSSGVIPFPGTDVYGLQASISFFRTRRTYVP